MRNRKPLKKADFAWVKWTPEDIDRVVCDIVFEKKQRYEKIKKIPREKRTFENTIAAIEFSSHGLARKSAQIQLLGQVHADKKVRDAAHRAEVKLAKEFIAIEYDKDIYKAFCETPVDLAELTEEEKILHDDMKKGYVHMGFALPPEKQKELKKILAEMQKLSVTYEKRINDYEDYIFVTSDELKGLPETYVSMLSTQGNKYKVSLAYPEYVPFMAGSHSEKKRKELMDKSLQKGGIKNIETLKRLIELRKKQASILGYKSYPDLRTELRAAGSERNVRSFLGDILSHTEKLASKEMDLLAAQKGKRLEYYDLSYYAKKVRQEKFSVDSDLLKEYFPLAMVKKEMFAHFETLFDVRFLKEKMTLWHPDVELYRVNTKAGQLISYFALDLYPRKGKYGHACVVPIQTGQLFEKTYTPAFAVMLTNFTRPSSVNPSLVSFGEIETFFHEFGHLMHHVLSDVRFPSQSGTHVAWDLVETPSQLFENWVWEKKLITRMSSHYKTGKKIPQKLLAALLKTRFFMAAYTAQRTATLALTDIDIHSKNIEDLDQHYNKLLKKYSGITLPKNHHSFAGFGHMAGGYDAGYYSYLWAEVYAYDLYTRFAKEGPFNKRVGKELREKVLSKGSSKSEMQLFEEFLGRKPSNKAFLKALKSR